IAGGAFILWGILHLVGGGMILMAAWNDPDAGFAAYSTASGGYDALAGDILGYFAYGLVALGAIAAIIGVRGNLKNDETALLANTVLVLLTEIGLIVFLLLPDHLSLLDASPGLILGLVGIVAGGLACHRTEAHHVDI
ncbi:MAG: hypothetical protein ABJO38_00135, partial [Stappiaceae bacterium]